MSEKLGFELQLMLIRDVLSDLVLKIDTMLNWTELDHGEK